MTKSLLTRRLTLQTAAAAGLSMAGGLPVLAQEGPEVLEMVKGAEDAPVTVIEYASFTCPHCQRFHLQVYPGIRENFIDTGKVKFIMREVYFDKFGLWAGLVARCAGPERYFGVVDLIFEKQSEWMSGDNEATIANNLRAIGRQAGMTNADIDACMQDQDRARALVETYQKNATADDVRGTPSFIINGTKQANMDYPDFEALLNKELDS